MWVADEIVDDGEVNLLGSHCCGLGIRGKKGWGRGCGGGTVYVL